MLVVHDWIKEYLGEKMPTPEEIEELLNLHAFEVEGIEEVAGHQVIDVDVLPNRSSDCLSHRGVAREIATIIDVEMEKDPLRDPLDLPNTDKVEITITDPQGCRKFGAAVVTGLTVKDSPDWLQKRLEAIGQRPINNIVDATNYVMFALGQPLHAYDAAKFPQKDGAWQFGVRYANDGEKITTLTGDDYELNGSIQLIVDGSNDKGIGIAGIKGGKYAEVDTHTTSIVLEAANFDPTITRRASQKLRLQTDASKRFENEPSRNLIEYALKAALDLLEDIGGGTCEGYVIEYPTPHKNEPVAVHVDQINALLGTSITPKEVEGILRRLGFQYEETDVSFVVTAPFERTDITIEEDVIEEVGRIYGYDHVQSVVPEAVPLTEINARHYYSEKVRGVLLSLGFSEVITSSFRKKDDIKLRNALASDKGCLRSSLGKNITEALDRNIHNVDLLGLADIRIFEIGTVFEKESGTVNEHVSLALGVRQKQQGYNAKDDTILEDALQKIEVYLNVTIDRNIEKGVAEINFSELLGQLPEPQAYELHDMGEDIQYKPFSTYPFVSRDIALWVDEGITAGDVEKVIQDTAGDLCVRTTLFDEFSKDGRMSYAFRLIFQAHDRTLTDGEVGKIMDGVYTMVTEKGWEVR